MLDKSAKYYMPFTGKPPRFLLDGSGLFLFPFEVVFRVFFGQSLSGVFSELDQSALYKRMERVSLGKASDEEKVSLERCLMDQIVAQKIGPEKYRQECCAALDGDEMARQRLESFEMGEWERIFSIYDEAGPKSYRSKRILDIEKASEAPLKCLRDNKVQEAVGLIMSNSLIREYLCHKTVEALARCRGVSAFEKLRLSISLEVFLSDIAALDLQAALNKGSEGYSEVIPVLPSPSNPYLNATQLLFRWIKTVGGYPSINAIFQDQRLSVSVSTLKRWSSGASFPDPIWYRAIVNAVLGDPNHAMAWGCYRVARIFNFLGYYSQQLVISAHKDIEAQEDSKSRQNEIDRLSPWPNLPFGYETFEEWCSERFHFWRDYHLKEIMAGK